jgi:hypothetical protein
VAPQIGETVYDPGSGTGGFLAESFVLMAGKNNENIETPDQLDQLRHDTFFGREKENLIYPIALANLVLHGIDQPNIWHGNTLTGGVTYDGLYTNAPDQFDVVMTNPPFGGKEGKEAQTRFAFKTGATQVLFLQHVIDSLKPAGRCGMVLDEGLVPHQRDGLRADQTQAARRMQPVLHRQPARRGVQRGRRRREDEPAVLQQGRTDRNDLVLRKPSRPPKRKSPKPNSGLPNEPKRPANWPPAPRTSRTRCTT